MEFVERETSDIKGTLAEVSKELGFPSKFIDFEIEEEQEKKDEQGNITKLYKVKYFINSDKSKLYDILDIEEENTEHPQKAYIVVNPSKMQGSIDISENGIVEIIKKVAALNKLVFLFKDKTLLMIAKEIKKRLNPSHKPFRILIAEGKKPVRGKNSELKFYFNRYHAAGSITKDGKIDYKKKNFLVPVQKGKVLIEFFKPTRGEEGYDVFGRIIPQDVGVVIEDLEDVKFNSDSIEKVDDGNVVKLISKKDGVIIYKNGTYDIDTTVSVDKVDIKTTGNLNADADVEIEIGSMGNDSVEDTIAAGMKVKAKKVTINGDVGPKAVVEADEVTIKGSVHQDAKIVAKKAVISICRGSVEADEVEIDLAEHARILSKNSAVINKSVASKITCPKIEIKEVMMSSNVTTSSESIFINKIEGGDNLIAIQPLTLPWIKEKYKELCVKREYAAVILKTNKKNYENALNAFEKEKQRYDSIKKTIKQLQEEKKEIPKPLLIVVKKFKECTQELKQAEEVYEQAKSELEKIQKEIAEMEGSYKKGHIIIKGEIKSGNKILFDDTLKRVVETPKNNVKIYVREIQGKEDIVIEPNNDTR